jgi:hypothetical protein
MSGSASRFGAQAPLSAERSTTHYRFVVRSTAPL